MTAGKAETLSAAEELPSR